MHKLFALPALLLTAYSTALIGCGGTTEAIAADAPGGAGGLSAGGASSTSNTAGSTSSPQHAAGASSSASGGPSFAGGPSEPSNSSEAGADSNSSTSSAIRCGNTTCDGETEYCFGAVGGLQPDQFQCQPLPAKCLATPTCACLQAAESKTGCPCTETDGLRLNCELG